MISTKELNELRDKRGLSEIPDGDEATMLFRTAQLSGYLFLWERIPSDHTSDNGALYGRISRAMEEHFGVSPKGYKGESDLDKLREAGVLSGYFMASEDYWSILGEDVFTHRCGYISSRYWNDAAFYLTKSKSGFVIWPSASASRNQ